MKGLIKGLSACLFLVSASSFAHTGVGQASGFLHGFGHPIGGADHMLAMVAVGLWAAQIGGRALWVVPCTFVSVMVLGGMLGISGVPIPYVEEGILVSILVLGVLIVGFFKLSLLYSSLIVGLFAVFHGHAHGAEMSDSFGAAAYAIGFSLATAMLHLVGMGLGVVMQKTNLQMISRFAGGAITLSGIYLAIS